MKILNVINNLAAGGAEKLLTDVLPLQQNEGNTVEVLICNDAANVPQFEKQLKDAGITIINLQSSFYNPLQVFKIIGILKKGNYDIVHAHLFPSQYWLAFASLCIPKNIKLVKTEHSIFNERKQYKILRPLEKFVYRRYHAIIAITEAVKENLVDWLQDDKRMYVINNGVNLKQIWQQQKEISPNVYEFLSKENFNMLMVGRFDGIHKDQTSLVKAFHHLNYSDAMLYFAGTGPGEISVKQIVNSLGLSKHIHFLGLRTDVYALMSLVDLNILSTDTEGLSGVALESMASGKPFIGSDVNGVSDVVPNAEFLFPSQNPLALASKIDELKNNAVQRQEMADLGYQHVKQWGIETMAKKYLKLYDFLLIS